MEFRDLKTQYQVLKEKIDKAMIDVAASNAYIMGSAVKELEASLAEYAGVKHCIACANGTDALSLALMAWGISEGDAVFVPDFTFFASAEVVSNEGAMPIFVDVDGQTFNMDSEKLEQAIKNVLAAGRFKPKAIIAVDLFGLPADYTNIKKIAQKYKLLLLEDAAQGFGGSINGKKACSFGDISITSFFPAKPLGCYGDGGAVFTDDDDYAELISSLKVHGKGSSKYDNVRIGMNSRLDTLQAAILQIKLDAFCEYELDKVNEAAKLYSENLKDIVKTPVVREGYYSSWAQYTIILKNKKQRDGLQVNLKEHDIPSMIYYLKPMHIQTVYKDLDYKEEDLLTSSMLCECVLSLPIHPYITNEDIETICGKVRDYIKES